MADKEFINHKTLINKGIVLTTADQQLTSASVMLVYSPQDKAIAKMLYDALQVDGITVWVDWEDAPPSGQWLEEIKRGVEQSDCIIFLLSQSSNQSEICNWEIRYALKTGKRILPVVCDDIEYNDVQKELTSLNWVFFKPEDEAFRNTMKILRFTLDHDLKHARYHTLILQSALIWEKNDYEKALLFNRDDVVKAKHWLSASALGKEPKPTTLHLSYLTASDQEERVKNRRRAVAIFFALIVIISIIWPGWGVFFAALVFSHAFVYYASSK